MNFRCFERLELKPRGHVFLVGEPGAGRSNLVEALSRVLSAESTRFPLLDDLDFFNRDLSRRIEIEVVLGELGPHLEQTFLDRLEFWDLQTSQLVGELTPGAREVGDSFEHVVRLCYRAEWDASQQQGKHWVDFPKFSDSEGGDFRTVPRILREELPVSFVTSSSSPLSLSARGDLRRLVDLQEQRDFPAFLDRLMQGVADLAGGLVESQDVRAALERVLEPLRVPFGIGERPAHDVVRFVPEGGSLAGVIRGLQATIKFDELLGFLQVTRHGSALSASLQLSQAIARTNSSDAVVVVDDFGENVSEDLAQHMAGVLRMRAGQVWLSTRRGGLGQSFSPEEFIRLTTQASGVRAVHLGHRGTSKAERLALRHLHLQILPAVTSKAVLIVEGPHDRSAILTTAIKLNREERIPLPAAHRIAILDAGAAEGSGGITAVPRLGTLARTLGFYVIALIDWDSDVRVAEERLRGAQNASNVVIRWPRSFGIERALLDGLDESIIRSTLTELSQALSVSLDFDPQSLGRDALIDRAIRFLKSSGGLHGAFVEALPEQCVPPLIRRCLERLSAAQDASDIIQL